MTPFFSIIVPVYNVEKYIEKCLRSIYNQTFLGYEVIIINDGTKDASREIIIEKCLYDSRFQLYDKPNGGLSSARNEGMKYASGKYILFIDADDWIESDYLFKINESIEADTDVLICKYQLDDTVIDEKYIPYESEHINKSYSGQEKEKEIIERHLIAYPRNGYEIRDTIMPVWKNVYRRKFIIENDLTFESERKVMTEDYVFNTEAYYYARSVQVTDIAGYIHVIVPGTLSRSYRFNAVDMSIHKHKILRQFIVEHVFLDKPSIMQAEMINFASAFSSDIRNFCASKEKGKYNKIKEWFSNIDLNEIFEYQIVLNLQYSLWFCTRIVLTRSPLLCLISFYIVNKFNLLYRWIQKEIRK